MQLAIDDFLRLRVQLPIVDVRSEGEFQHGHIPSALNIPLLNNEERIVVGTTYKQEGQQSAIRAGFSLVGPRLSGIINEIENAGRELLVHCWRGGMRSGNFCQFAMMAQVKTHQLQGGYKSYRAKAIESFSRPMNLMVIGGCTGSGKSDILRELKSHGEQVIDLELLASHKGSVFGGLMMKPQPTTEQFQNDLFEELITLDLQKRTWIEDESISVGKIFLPEGLWRQMHSSPVVEIEVSKEVRIQRLVDEYGHADKVLFLEAMTRIVQRLGFDHFKEAKEKLEENDMAAVIEILLTYYDKAYTNGLTKRKLNVMHRQSWDGVNAESIVNSLIAS